MTPEKFCTLFGILRLCCYKEMKLASSLKESSLNIMNFQCSRNIGCLFSTPIVMAKYHPQTTYKLQSTIYKSLSTNWTVLHGKILFAYSANSLILLQHDLLRHGTIQHVYSSPYSIYSTFPMVRFKIVPVNIDCWIKSGEHIESILAAELQSTAIWPTF